MRQKIALFLIIFLSTLWGYGQEKWTLKQCIDYAIEHNIQVQQQTLNAQMARNNLRQSKAALLPSLNFNANHSWNFGHTVDPYTNDFIANNSQNDNFSLSGNITLFNGFQLLNTIRRNYFEYQASLSDRQKLINDISLNVATAYLQILYDKENRQVAEEQLQVNKEQLARSRLLYRAGSIAQGDVLTAEAQLANAEMQLVAAQNQLEMSKLNLVQIMNLDSAGRFDIVYPDLSEISKSSLLLSIDSIYQAALLQLPEIQSQTFKLKSGEIALSMARGNRLPRVFLSGNYGTGYSDSRKRGTYVPVTQMIGYTASQEPVYATSMQYQPEDYPFNDQLKDNANKSLSIGMSIPIFNGYQIQTQIANAKISVANAQLSLQNTRLQIYKQIRQAYADAVAAYNKYEAAKKSLEAQQKAFEYMQKKFNVGMATTVDFNNAKSNLFKARSDMLRNKYEFVFKLKILDFYQGHPITF